MAVRQATSTVVHGLGCAFLCLPVCLSAPLTMAVVPTIALLHQVIIRSTAKAAGHTWLREHLRSNYTAAWHEVLRVRVRVRVKARVRVRVSTFASTTPQRGT
eukprot:scaffold32664_cov69-Phaeocystis_antarctica.AAC.3